MSNLYYIRNKERGYLGNSPMWWAVGGSYTAYLQNAKKFPKAEAKILVESDPEKWAMYECDKIDRRTHLVFDSQDFGRVDEELEEVNPWGSKAKYANQQ